MLTRFSKRIDVLACCLCVTTLSLTSYAGNDWAGWRGPSGTGHSDETGLPVRWNKNSIAWKTPLPGRGQSTPAIWGDRIFLTTALNRGRERVVICLDRNDGQVLWEQVAWTGAPEPIHGMNSWASPSCTTDGQRVYAFFGKGGGLFCYSVQGKRLWQKELGEFMGPWGTAATPLLVGNLVIQACDADADAFITGIDKKTGATIWTTKREDFRGWSSPVLIHANGRAEVVLNGHTGVRAYDPATGAELWYCQGYRGRGTPTVTPANGLVYAVDGRTGCDLYAVKPGGSGTVTQTHTLWRKRRTTGRDLSSPIVIGETVLLMNMRGGVLTGYHAKTGAELWKQRVGGNFSASPISYGGLALFINEAGETVVIDPAVPKKIVARNTIDPADNELFRASITPSDGQLFLRSDRVLYCIGKRNSALR